MTEKDSLKDTTPNSSKEIEKPKKEYSRVLMMTLFFILYVL